MKYKNNALTKMASKAAKSGKKTGNRMSGKGKSKLVKMWKL